MNHRYYQSDTRLRLTTNHKQNVLSTFQNQ